MRRRHYAGPAPEPLAHDVLAYFLEETDRTPTSTLAFYESDESIRPIWQRASQVVIAEYAERHPGRRPQAWWDFEAPEQRRMVGGTGVPRSTVSAYVPEFVHGIPIMARVDPASPPIFESEPTYLVRHNRLLPGERRLIPPSAFRARPLDPSAWTTEQF